MKIKKRTNLDPRYRSTKKTPANKSCDYDINPCMKIKKTRNLYLMFCKAKKSLRNQFFTTKPTRELRNRCFSHLNDSSCVYLCVFSICVFAQVLRNNRFLLQIQVWRPVVRYPQTAKNVSFDTKLITRS